MALYGVPPKQVLLNAITAENPKLAGATLSQFAWSPVTVVSGAQTSIKLRGLPSQGWTGVQRVTYNRILLPTLFAQVTLRVQQFNATKLSDLLPRFNELYGVNLTAADLAADPAITGTSGTLAMTATPSVQYSGSVNLAWVKGTEPQLWERYAQRNLSPLSIPTLMLTAFALDFSANTAVIENHNDEVPLMSGSTTARALVEMLADRTGLPLTLVNAVVPGTGPYDLSGYTVKRYDRYAVVDADPAYTRVMVLTPPVAAYGKQQSPVYLHYGLPIPVNTIITNTELDGLETP